MQTAISDYNHLAHARVLRQIQKNYVLLYSFALFYFELRAISKYKPPRAYIRRVDLTEEFLRYEFRGLIHGGAYFRNFTVFNLYNQLRILQKFTEKDTNNPNNSSRIKSGFLEDRA